MPDIPRIYTAIAEWVACMLFILPVKKRFDRLKTGLLAAGALIIQSLFLMVTGNVRIYFWIPCMVIAVLLMMVLFMDAVRSACEMPDTLG